MSPCFRTKSIDKNFWSSQEVKWIKNQSLSKKKKKESVIVTAVALVTAVVGVPSRAWEFPCAAGLAKQNKTIAFA